MNHSAVLEEGKDWPIFLRELFHKTASDDLSRIDEELTMNYSQFTSTTANVLDNNTLPTITITASSVSMVVSCFVLMLVTIVGNTLVILAFNIEPSLQVITNHWIVSLALTDIILAAVVMPLQISRELFDGKWIFGTVACDLFICLDVLCCTCSIYHLCLISLDRYFCIRYPITYPRIRTPRATLAAICTTWFCCISISFPRLLGWKDQRDDEYSCHMTNMAYMLFSSAVSFYIPLLLICIMYYGIYRVTKAQARKFSCFSSSYRLSSGHCLVPEATGEGFVSTALIATTLDAALTITTRQSDESRSSELEPASYSGTANSFRDSGFTRPTDRSRNRALERPRLKFIDRLRYRLGVIGRFGKGDATISLANGQAEKTSRERAYDQEGQAPSTSHTRATDIELTKTDTPRLAKAIVSLHSNDSSCRKERMQRARLTRRRQKQETRAAKVVIIVLMAFVLLWAPFFVVNVVSPLCGIKCRISDEVWKLVTWLGYCNSSINPFIYTCFNRTFRRAFVNVFKFCCRCGRPASHASGSASR